MREIGIKNTYDAGVNILTSWQKKMNEQLNINANLVFSSDHGKICPKCARPVDACICNEKKQPITGDGKVRICRQTKGRKGKGVTIITGIPLPTDELKDLARTLKNKCGCGGTVKNGDIEIQGDQRDRLMEELKKQGYNPKLAGG